MIRVIVFATVVIIGSVLLSLGGENKDRDDDED